MALSSSLVRQNFSEEVEALINKQINMELHASYTYLAMAYHFNREDVALQGHYKFFKECSEEEREHADKLLEYLNKRGGKIILEDISAPVTQHWETAEQAMSDALELERAVNESLLTIHATASDHKDANLCDFLETHYLQEQVDSIKKLADYITNLKRVGEGLGVYMFDQKLHS